MRLQCVILPTFPRQSGQAVPTPGGTSPEAGGVLRYGLDLTNTGGVTLDPLRSNTFGDALHMRLIYDRDGGDGVKTG